MTQGFWKTLKRPIIGLAPMDGITDAAFRYMVCSHSRPSVMITEFTNVEGLARGAIKMLGAFAYHEMERPIVAQIYGVEVDSFYKAAVMVARLGFDGIDINMGCPVNKVARKGSGAALIRTPSLAQTIVRTVQKAAKDWADGMTPEEADIHPDILGAVKKMQPHEPERRHLPVSIKTRIGYDEVVTTTWIKTLLEVQPANISLHGRTLKQLYTGQADWEQIALAAKLCKGTGTTLLGNGDIQTLEEAHEKIKTYGVDGVLAGRATWGNPWFFKGIQPTPTQSLQAAMQHGTYLEKNFPEINFAHLRKHLIWYCRDFAGARELRAQLMRVENSEMLRASLGAMMPLLQNGHDISQ